MTWCLRHLSFPFNLVYLLLIINNTKPIFIHIERWDPHFHWWDPNHNQSWVPGTPKHSTWCKTLTVNVVKLQTLSSTMLTVRSWIHKMFVRIAKREDPDQTDQVLCCLWQSVGYCLYSECCKIPNSFKYNVDCKDLNSQNVCQNSKQGRPWSDCVCRSHLIWVCSLCRPFWQVNKA